MLSPDKKATYPNQKEVINDYFFDRVKFLTQRLGVEFSPLQHPDLLALHIVDNYEDSGKLAAAYIAAMQDTLINFYGDEADNLAFCGATGHTQKTVNQSLVSLNDMGLIRPKIGHWTHLDNRNVPNNSHLSFPREMKNNLWNLIKIPFNKRFSLELFGFQDPQRAIKRIKTFLKKHPLAVTWTGVGTDGHMAFVMPGDENWQSVHVTVLNDETIQREIDRGDVGNDGQAIRENITLGLEDITSSMLVVTVANDPSKAEAIKRMLEGEINPIESPASYIRSKNNGVVILTKDAASSLSEK